MTRPTLSDVFDMFEDFCKRENIETGSVWESKELTRTSFFDEAHWAILVAGRNVDSGGAREWHEKARTCGLPFDWQGLSQWGDDEFDSWCKRMAGVLVVPQEDLTGGFRNRWWGIWDLAWYLAEFDSDDAFREVCFDGKRYGNQLGDEDFHRLLRIKRSTKRFYGIGPASTWFIMRNLGGDFLKPDTWINAFADWYGTSVAQLAVDLRTEGIHCGQFDIYCWEYCRAEIRVARDLPNHFDGLFG